MIFFQSMSAVWVVSKLIGIRDTWNLTVRMKHIFISNKFLSTISYYSSIGQIPYIPRLLCFQYGICSQLLCITEITLLNQQVRSIVSQNLWLSWTNSAKLIGLFCPSIYVGMTVYPESEDPYSCICVHFQWTDQGYTLHVTGKASAQRRWLHLLVNYQ